MVNINLHSEKTSEEFDEKKSSRNGLVISGSIFLILVLIYGGLIFYKSRLDNKTSEAVQNYRDQSADFLNDEKTKDVFNFQNRLNVAGKFLSEPGQTLDILGELENIIIPGIYIRSYDYDGEKNVLVLELVCDQYNNVAKQVLNFKKSNYFSEVNLSKTTIDEKGKINMPVELRISKPVENQ